MFDPGLLLALDQIPSSIPQKPVLPIEQVLTSPRAAWAANMVTAEIERARKHYVSWEASMREIVRKLYETAGQEWDGSTRVKLDQAVGFFENLAEGMARGSAREERRASKINRQLPADLAHSHRTGMKLILAFEQERIQGLLDLALQFRAFRSTIAPGASKGPVFESGADLDKFLGDALHA